jgi:hypothetical protein
MVRGLVPLFGIDPLGLGPRVFIFRKRAVPAVGEIEDRHVKDKHGVVPGCARSKKVAHSALENVFTLFRFHCDLLSLNASGTPTFHYPAVAGFWGASFEGGRKGGAKFSYLLDF